MRLSTNALKVCAYRLGKWPIRRFRKERMHAVRGKVIIVSRSG